MKPQTKTLFLSRLLQPQVGPYNTNMLQSPSTCFLIFLLTIGLYVNADDVLSFSQTDYCTFLSSLTKTPGYLNPKKSSINDAAKFITRAFYDIPRDAWNHWNFTDEQVSALFHVIETRDPCADLVYPIGDVFPFHPYDDSMEGQNLAPKSHTVVWKSPLVDVVHWNLAAGYQEPYHTHLKASMTFRLVPAGRTYYNESGIAVDSTGKTGNATNPIAMFCQPPEWLHSIENLDDHSYQVIRVFFNPQVTLSYMPHLN